MAPPHARSSSTAHRSWARTYLPPQHGAWAMLVAPFVVGTSASSWTWTAPVLLVAWLDAYLLSYYVLQWAKTGRRQRYLPQIRLYGLVLVPSAAVLVAAEPWLVLAAAALVPFSAVNAWYARRHDERALANGIVSVTQACLMVPIAYGVGGGEDWLRAAQLFTACWLYFAGTVVYVKTMIREKGDRTYLRLSIGFHVVAVVLAAWVAPWLALPFGLYLARAVLMPRRAAVHPVRPAQVGAVEIVNTVLLVAVALLATSP